MGKQKKAKPGPVSAKDRHKRAGKVSKPIDRSEPLPPGLVAAKPIHAVTNSKHQSYFEFIENKDKKKPLLFEITPNRVPPPGMKYIPIGNPELTERCKEISREVGASVYIVTQAKREASELSQQIHRVGHHIREYIVDRAMHELGQNTFYEPVTIGQGEDEVEEIPRSQAEINRQADAALRELFPRIPHTDRQQIIDHAFKKGKTFNGDLVVGLQQELSLSRRVQLAVLAHIRHNHTRYDQLLRETTWANARRVTEQLCLDILVKWRGDDENGRNSLDEILREVVVLSDDSEDSDSGEDDDSDSSAVLTDRSANVARPLAQAVPLERANGNRMSTAAPSRPGSPKPMATPPRPRKITKKMSKKAKRAARREKRNFSRYEAAANLAWNSAMQRQRQAPDGQATQTSQAGAGSGPVSNGSRPNQSVVFMEGRAPANDLGSLQPQRPAPGSSVNNPHETQRAEHSFAPPTSSRHFPSGSAMHKVNESGGMPASSIGLQDYLHPSIEPKSPDAGRPPSRFQRPLVEYADLADDYRPRRVQSPPRGPVVRDQFSHPQRNQGYPSHNMFVSNESMFSREPAASYRGPPREPPRPLAYGAPRQSDPLLRRNEPELGARHNPITIEDARPQTVILGPGESMRDRFGPGVEILSVRRPGREGLAPERQRVAPMDEGFIRLREEPRPLPRDGLREEGFLRIREHPDAMPRRPNQLAYGRSSLGDLPSQSLGSFRTQPAAPDQAIYVRRAEPMPPTGSTYPAPGARRMDGMMYERPTNREIQPLAYGGSYLDHQQPQGAYGIPVHRHARPVRVEEPPIFQDYPPTPPRPQQWPRSSEDIIILD
ncbi:hypothetical protein CkaCkLH20_12361 [Colletotrichum karsti]|uniref:DUF2293 domain-containing protein n=1 Tax=Colletotrichum karsti TaxID=1095194 RepID=A0A9P6HUM5_9PEZI|nr:uncharacterized protein CkaCkLH20_12361 [Colletotrichum karsti]KAF9870127.1 hypothetical protein CkaCkLH20_12361 [Colletotrichum karsti]